MLEKLSQKEPAATLERFFKIDQKVNNSHLSNGTTCIIEPRMGIVVVVVIQRTRPGHRSRWGRLFGCFHWLWNVEIGFSIRNIVA